MHGAQIITTAGFRYGYMCVYMHVIECTKMCILLAKIFISLFEDLDSVLRLSLELGLS